MIGELVIPFNAPSAELLDMLVWLHEAQSDFYACMAVEAAHHETQVQIELTDRQVELLLTRGAL